MRKLHFYKYADSTRKLKTIRRISNSQKIVVVKTSSNLNFVTSSLLTTTNLFQDTFWSLSVTWSLWSWFSSVTAYLLFPQCSVSVVLISPITVCRTCPTYLWNHLVLHITSCHAVWTTHSFAVCGPTAWNSLPAATHDLSSSPSCFYSRVKTELFATAYGVSSL